MKQNENGQKRKNKNKQMSNKYLKKRQKENDGTFGSSS
jgi:hypothetical protein